MSAFAVILAAAGKSSRFKDPHFKKPFVRLGDKPVWLHAAERFINRPDVRQVLLVLAEEDVASFQEKYGANVALLGIRLVVGGATRSESVRNALEKVDSQAEFVAVHDAARPCLAGVWIDNVFAAAQRTGAAILAVPVRGTLKRAAGSQRVIAETVSREGLWEAQTPQVFRRELLQQAHARGGSATDDAALVEALGHPVTLVEGSPINLKITTQEDLRLAKAALRALPQPSLAKPAHPFANGDMWR